MNTTLTAPKSSSASNSSALDPFVRLSEPFRRQIFRENELCGNSQGSPSAHLQPTTEGDDLAPSQQALARYYRLHALIYDWTRWLFLFGRSSLVKNITRHMMMPQRILEVGCGTGTNLVRLADRFPKAQIIGLDLSKDMLDQARTKLKPYGSRVGLLHRSYSSPIALNQKFDLIVFSYSLTMMNPGYEEVLQTAQQDLSARGIIAVVDFHDSRWSWFKRWMGANHVRMEGQVLQTLGEHFQPLQFHICQGYHSLWSYLSFIGKAK